MTEPMSARDTAPLRPQPGDLVVAEVESLPRIIRDIEAWFNDGSDNAAHPIDFICDLRDRLQGLVDYNAYRAGDAAGDPGLRAALALLIAQLRGDAEAHRREAQNIRRTQPDATRPAATYENVLAKVHDYWADAVDELLARATDEAGA